MPLNFPGANSQKKIIFLKSVDRFKEKCYTKGIKKERKKLNEEINCCRH